VALEEVRQRQRRQVPHQLRPQPQPPQRRRLPHQLINQLQAPQEQLPHQAQVVDRASGNVLTKVNVLKGVTVAMDQKRMETRIGDPIAVMDLMRTCSNAVPQIPHTLAGAQAQVPQQNCRQQRQPQQQRQQPQVVVPTNIVMACVIRCQGGVQEQDLTVGCNRIVAKHAQAQMKQKGLLVIKKLNWQKEIERNMDAHFLLVQKKTPMLPLNEQKKLIAFSHMKRRMSLSVSSQLLVLSQFWQQL